MTCLHGELPGRCPLCVEDAFRLRWTEGNVEYAITIPDNPLAPRLQNFLDRHSLSRF